jgi:predicted permease
VWLKYFGMREVFMGIVNRLIGLFRRSRMERDLDEELQHHIELKTQQNIDAGMSPEEARYAALRAFGGVEQKKEQCRDADRLRWLDDLVRDVRYALRQLRRNPGFTAVAVITLALGIGATTAIFTVVNGVILNPLPYPQADRLVALAEKLGSFSKFPISYPDFLDWEKMNRSIEALAAYRYTNLNLTGLSEAERVKATLVSASFFPLLGVKPIIGRNFSREEDRVGAAPVAILSAGFWQRKFGGSADILGKVLPLDGRGYTVIGVIPESCCETTNSVLSDVYVPIGSYESSWNLSDRNTHLVYAIGRLKRGATLQQARADMDGIARNLASTFPYSDKNEAISLTSLKEQMVGNIKPTLLVLLAAVGFVLLIACANVANLLLARSTGRAREFAIRSALGASRGRVVQQLLAEGITLALTGGGLGLILASWATKAGLAVLPEALPRANDVRPDARVLAFTLITSILVGVLFGLAPALQSSCPDLQGSLKEGGRNSVGTSYHAQRVFVVAEVALAVVLLFAAGLMIRSLARLWRVNPGFNAHNVLTFKVALPPSIARETPDQIRASIRHLADAVRAVPGVKAASINETSLPLASGHVASFWVEGRAKPSTEAEMLHTFYYIVGTDYFKVMRIPLLRGRLLTRDDDLRTRFVAVIDEDFARTYFRNQDPVGKHVYLPPIREPFEIVGEVGHVDQTGLAEDNQSPLWVQFYFPAAQVPDQYMSFLERTAGFVVRTQSPKYPSIEAIRRAIEAMNARQVAYGFESMGGLIARSLASRRFAMILLAVFAALALILASIGIYGVVSYSVARRTHEIGVRVALGAQKGDVCRLVVGEGMILALFGVGIGILGAFGLTHFLSNMLYGVKPTDPLTFVTVSMLLTGVALLACWIPARRAAEVDPITALRYE